MDSIEVDAFVLGAGPAGCSVAINLAPFFHTLMVDRNLVPQPRAGESLPPAANKLLVDMGLIDEFKQQGHLPYYGNQSRWGSEHLSQSDFLHDPMGHGWHLDRPKFESWLRHKAITRGSILLAPARLSQLESETNQRWKITVTYNNRRMVIHARLLIDAGGRTPGLAKRLGATRIRLDNLVCGWLIGEEDSDRTQRGLSYIQSTPEGWWYTAPTPDKKRIVAFHTRAGNAATTWMHSANSIMEQARKTPYLCESISFLNSDQDPRQLQHGYSAANSAITRPTAGSGWMTAGDASLSLDPLSSQGIFNALYTGLAASESAYRFLSGQILDFAEYQQQLAAIHVAYERHLHEWYGLEKRWSGEDFWRER